MLAALSIPFSFFLFFFWVFAFLFSPLLLFSISTACIFFSTSRLIENEGPVKKTAQKKEKGARVRGLEEKKKNRGV